MPAARSYLGLPKRPASLALQRGLTQLSLVEHALCPLDAQTSLRPNLEHTAEYFFSDRQGQRRKAIARVLCPQGLSANDEFYLWGLLALTFSQSEPTVEFSATPYYCLRQLGLIDDALRRGGKTYELFRAAIERLSAVTYQNSGFYDPIRGEHCEVSFGFLSYRLPLGNDSSRAWRFYWDPLFFELCQASGSALSFDLATYRRLDTAGRRLYLLLKKVFYRHPEALTFDLRHLAVDVLGYSPTQAMWRLKLKVMSCIQRLVDQGILATPTQGSVKSLVRKQRKGQYRVVLHRGPHFDQISKAAGKLVDSPHYELLQAIGFDGSAITRILGSYSPKLVGEWADIALAAREHNGESFFKVSPQAYFIDNIRCAAAGQRTPPDWWLELRKAEEKSRRPTVPEDPEAALDSYLESEARQAFDQVANQIFGQLSGAGLDQVEARHRARYIARQNLKTQFYREHPERRPAEPANYSADPQREDE